MLQAEHNGRYSMKSTEVLNPQRSAFDGRRHVCTHKLTSLDCGHTHILFCVEALGQNTKPLSRKIT